MYEGFQVFVAKKKCRNINTCIEVIKIGYETRFITETDSCHFRNPICNNPPDIEFE